MYAQDDIEKASDERRDAVDFLLSRLEAVDNTLARHEIFNGRTEELLQGESDRIQQVDKVLTDLRRRCINMIDGIMMDWYPITDVDDEVDVAMVEVSGAIYIPVCCCCVMWILSISPHATRGFVVVLLCLCGVGIPFVPSIPTCRRFVPCGSRCDSTSHASLPRRTFWTSGCRPLLRMARQWVCPVLEPVSSVSRVGDEFHPPPSLPPWKLCGEIPRCGGVCATDTCEGM